MLDEAWRATVPGDGHHAIGSDAATGSVVVGDGWGVAYAALRLHRLDLATGRETASVRTRHQGVGGVAFADGDVLAATDKRLLRLRAADLSVVQEWDEGVVRDVAHVVPWGGRVVMAGWLRPTVGVLDPATGTVKRVKAGDQPVLVAGDELYALAGLHGGLSTLDVAAGKLSRRADTPPVTAAAWCDGLWAVEGGRLDGGQGDPAAWWRAATATVRCLDGEARVKLGDECRALFPDRARRLLWCVTAEDGARLECIDTAAGAAVGCFAASDGGSFRHVDPEAGLAFAVRRTSVEPAVSALSAHPLPS